MRIQGGCLSLEVVEAVSQQKCPENIEPSSGETFVQVDPKAHYMVRMSINGGGDPNRVFLSYVNINEEYVGYRQCLSQREGFQDVSVCSTIVGVNKPIRFQEAKLLETGNGHFHSNILHVGKVTVKIYEGLCERRAPSAFGNNVAGSQQYQPGRFVESLTIHCCSTPEAGHSYLNMVDADRLKKALLKRSTSTDHCEGPANYKRVKTETGFVSVAHVPSNNNGGGMECDMVMQQQPRAWPLA